MELQPAPEDEHEGDGEEDNYHGSSGWLVVAVGLGERACVLAIDGRFGAARWMANESGLHDPDEWGLSPPGDVGVYFVRARAWTSRSWEGEHDMGIEATGEWLEAGAVADKVRQMCEALDLLEQREQEASEADEKVEEGRQLLVAMCGWERRLRSTVGGMVSGEEWRNGLMGETVETLDEAVERTRSWVRFLREWTR